MKRLRNVKKVIKKEYAATIFLIFLSMLLLFRPPEDLDFGWHYKYGEYIFTHGRILRDNIFSFTNTNYQWANSYWLSQLFFYTTHNFLGSIPASLLTGFILGVIVIIVTNKATRNLLVRVFSVIFLLGVLNWFAVSVRPMGFSTVFLLILVYILIHDRAKIRYLPVLFLIWANFHADFTIGLFIFGCYLLERNVRLIKTEERTEEKLRSLLTENAVLLAGTLATLVNPYGIDLWVTLLKEITQPIKSFNTEWSYINPRSFEDYITISFMFGIGIMTALNFRKKTGNWYPFAVLFFFLFSVKAAYMARIFLVICHFGIIHSLEELVSMFSPFLQFQKRTSQLVVNASVSLFLFLVLGVSLSYAIPKIHSAVAIERWSDLRTFPYGCVQYIKENPLNGNMFNNYNWGGYLIWQLPEYKTFIDGRMTAWQKKGSYFMEDYLKVELYPEENKELLNYYFNTYGITWVITSPDSAIGKYLINSAQDKWEIVYSDKVCEITKKI